MFIDGPLQVCRRSVLAPSMGAAVLALAFAGCGVPMGHLGIKATDTWTHTYPLSNNGEVTIVNANGRIEVEGVDGSTVEVQAERIASGATEQLARELLPRIPIEEHATPDFVSVETRRLNGFLIGASYEVRYTIKVPRTATIRARTVNGFVSVSAMDGRVIAQPPGKRLQSVQLLSGGEKALTAIALMFGLFKFKPSPFCLLDEIDAPLDDANIGRFVEMLRSMLRHTQFILITHNRKTMEIADRLYGVTMEEPGVSKLISVQLN